MYSRCIFCKAPLGSNEAIESFTVGRRLAFDASKGRLWVVCPTCERWNLTPLEERWEAVETAERLYRGTRVRAQTDNIGLVKVKDGTELVRIGPALRPEFAAWRYGRVFGRRMQRQLLAFGGGTAAVAAGIGVGGAPLLAAAAAAAPFLAIGGYLTLMLTVGTFGRMRATRVVGADGKVLRVVASDIQHVKLLGTEGDDPFRLVLKHSYGRQELAGERARRALGALLARVNRLGAGERRVRDATTFIAEAGSAEAAARSIARASEPLARELEERWQRFQRGIDFREALRADLRRGEFGNTKEPMRMGPLWRLPRAQRLALEMALHESTERRALEGELALLEAAWREAEEIAAIADAL